MRLEMQIVLSCFQYTNGGVDSIPALPQRTLRALLPGYGAVEMKQELSLHFIGDINKVLVSSYFVSRQHEYMHRH